MSTKRSSTKYHQSRQEWIRPALNSFVRLFSLKSAFLVKISTAGKMGGFDRLPPSVKIMISIFLQLVYIFKILLGNS